MIEKVVYSPSPTSPEKQTVAVRSAWIDSSLFGFRRAIESFGVERFRKNCGQAVLGFNFVLRKMFPLLLLQQEVDTGKPGEGNVEVIVGGRFGGATEKMRETVRQVGNLAKGSISMMSVYTACKHPRLDK